MTTRDFRWLPPADLDQTDETFRFRRAPRSGLRESILRRGVTTPLLVQPRATGWRIVSGWSRALSAPRDARLPCFTVDAETSLEALWDLTLEDNEDWNVVEIARVLAALAATASIDAERIVRDKLPRLGLRPSNELYQSHLRLLDLPRSAQDFVEEKNLPLRRARALLRFSSATLGGLMKAARELALTFSELNEALELTEEIAQRETKPPHDIFSAARASARDKSQLIAALRARRFPELDRYRESLRRLDRELDFALPIRIEWDADLDRPGVRLIADLEDEDALRRLPDELARNGELLRRFFDVL